MIAAVRWCGAVIMAATAAVSGAQAQVELPLDTVAKLPAASANSLRRAALKLLEDPVRLNRALDRVLAGDGRWRLLKDLHLQFKTFEGRDEERAGLGVSYDYAKSIKHGQLQRTGPNSLGLGLDFAAAGNVAFDHTINPRDFLSTNLALGLEMNRGGVVRLGRPDQVRLDSLERIMADIEDQAVLDASPVWREYLGVFLSALTTQFWIGASARARFESDQTFDRTQFVYGADLAVDLKAWNPKSVLAQWNLLDWPFAAIRWLAGTDSTFRPRGQAYPTLRMGLAVVDVGQNPEREELGETGTFPRFDLEAAFKSLLFRAGETDVSFAADLRWFSELGAPTSVQEANLASNTYFAATITSSAGPYATFSAGRLPFDLRNQQVYEIGFHLTF